MSKKPNKKIMIKTKMVKKKQSMSHTCNKRKSAMETKNIIIKYLKKFS